MSDNIRTFLDLSTGHLPVQDRLLIDLHRPSLPLRVCSNEYGWSMWLQDEKAMIGVVDELENSFGLTDALGHVIRYALHHKCDMINFDRDAGRIEGLDYFDE